VYRIGVGVRAARALCGVRYGMEFEMRYIVNNDNCICHSVVSLSTN
jgi:hypothetical protein